MSMRNPLESTLNQRVLLFGFGLSMTLPMASNARPDYVNRVPTPYRCETCHQDPSNRNLRTGFGIDFGLARGVWANDDPEAGICHLDSDGDELTNGQELGDPDCLWRVGDRRPNGPTTNPADPRDPDRCGDGVLQAGEACDGEALGEATCISEGFMEGTLACRNDCNGLDTSDCIAFPEPDMAVEPDQGVPDMGASPAGDASALRDLAMDDSGEPDAELTDDASPSPPADAQVVPEDDAGVAMMDLGAERVDGGEASSSPSSGGGCTMTGPTHGVWWFVLVGVLFVRRRRARRVAH